MTLRRKLGLLLFSCALLATLLITFFVNQTILHQVEQYMYDNQAKRNDRLITYFEDYYASHGQFDEKAGAELAHEAYMNNYCLVLMDVDYNVIWGMSPNEMGLEAGEIHQADTYELVVNDDIIGYLEIGQHMALLLSQEDLLFKQAINQSIFISAIITMMIIGGISYIFSKPLSLPIKKVSDMARRLATGDFKEEVIENLNIQELDSLQQSMNHLAKTLMAHEEARKQLISDVSHELRTPLNILQTNLEGMMDGVIPVDEARLQALHQEVVRFGKLVSNLEVLKQFESKTVKFKREPINLQHVMVCLLPEFELLMRQKQIKLTVEIEDAWIEGDEDQLKQVFINLISNAYKFTPPFGNVCVSVTSHLDTVQVEIQDSGVGIEKEHQSKIFNRFYRVDPSRHQIEGSGIGLTIVKQIVKLHEGSIEVRSEKGQGTTFVLRFKDYSS